MDWREDSKCKQAAQPLHAALPQAASSVPVGIWDIFYTFCCINIMQFQKFFLQLCYCPCLEEQYAMGPGSRFTPFPMAVVNIFTYTQASGFKIWNADLALYQTLKYNNCRNIFITDITYALAMEVCAMSGVNKGIDFYTKSFLSLICKSICTDNRAGYEQIILTYKRSSQKIMGRERKCKSLPFFLSKLFSTITSQVASQNQWSPPTCSLAITMGWFWLLLVTKYPDKQMELCRIYFIYFSDQRNKSGEEENNSDWNKALIFFPWQNEKKVAIVN